MIFLVTGHRRGGTTYTATLFQKLSYDVQHEQWGKHGMCAWFAAVAMSSYFKVPWGNGSVRYHWNKVDQIVHLLRSPYRTICSTLARDWTIRAKVKDGNEDAFAESPWNFVRQYVNIDSSDMMEIAILGFVGWHKLIRALGPDCTIKIEEIDEALPAYLSSLGLAVYDRDDIVLDRAEWAFNEKFTQMKREFLDKYTPEFIREHCRPEVIEELEEFCAMYSYDTDTFDWRASG